MSDIAIRVENLGKLYRIGQQEPYKTLRDVLTDAMFTPFRRLFGNLNSDDLQCAIRNPQSEGWIWALKDVSFEVEQGEVIGIIGRNGAGKTTLLKILSQITGPTEGYADVRGRVGSLLEVGTGFHPELTGRENVYLNGAILGMKKEEIDRKFDEIVSFAEVEKFIDTPVKRYSTGMQVRLAFAVAAHLEPEILLVDEVLAVGDARFQKRCLGKMDDVAKSGRTVLFVSHNMQAVSLLCNRAILLEEGKVVADGPARQVVSEYLATESKQAAQETWSSENAPGNEVVKLRSVRTLNEEREVSHEFNMGEAITLEVEFWCLRKARILTSFHVYNDQGMLLFTTENLHNEWGQIEYEPGFYQCSCTIPSNLFIDGRYYATVYLSRGPGARIDVHEPEVISFEVKDDGSGRGDYMGEWRGLIRPLLPWTGKRLGDSSRYKSSKDQKG